MRDPGLYKDIPNEQYHSENFAVSKSMLDLVHQSPSLLLWSRDAPVDEEAEKAVDMGNAFECLLLEPDRFAATYAQAPQVDKRTKTGKDEWAAFERQCLQDGYEPLTRDQWRQVHFMRDSTMAHPIARRAFEAAALTQASYYWRDEDTGLLCRCRPDFMLEHVPFVIDVKICARIDQFPASVEEYRYHVQDSYYSDGLTNYYNGERPSFAFVAVSSSRSAGRYPVHVYELKGTDPITGDLTEDKLAGRRAYRRDLETYARCLAEDEFTHVEPLARPWWARRNDDG